MKTTIEIVDILKQHSSELRNRFGITSMVMFGSVAKGTQTADSDLDVFVDMPPTLRAVGGAQIYLENLFGCDVDLVRNNRYISNLFRNEVNQYGIKIF